MSANNLQSLTSTQSSRLPAKSGFGGRRYFEIKKGLDLPITGKPEISKNLENATQVSKVAVIGTDFIGLKPTMTVQVKDRVKRGQLLFTDKKNPRVGYTSPAGGTIIAINRGDKRALLSVEIKVDGKEEEETFTSYSENQLAQLSPEEVKTNLLASGLWTALRTRPFSKIPSPETEPHSLFVNAMDTSPLAVDPKFVIERRENDFIDGLRVVSKLTNGALYLCFRAGESMPGSDLDFVTAAEFKGPHPAGLAGTHIHFLDPVSAHKTVWHLNYQDILAIGRLFTTGKLDVERVISLAGPMVSRPRFLRTRLGASIKDLTAAELKEGDVRTISGSVLFGQKAEGPHAFLGRYHLQVSAIRENPERLFLEWHRPGFDRFSVKRTFISRIFHGKKFAFTTSNEGSDRSMVPIGTYEKVMPLDMVITFLLRALIILDTDQAQALGCLELDEEDLALCTFACPAKYDFGPILRDNLTTIEIEG